MLAWGAFNRGSHQAQRFPQVAGYLKGYRQSSWTPGNGSDGGEAGSSQTAQEEAEMANLGGGCRKQRRAKHRKTTRRCSSQRRPRGSTSEHQPCPFTKPCNDRKIGVIIPILSTVK